ncbi:MAG TPA: ParA family protein [Rhizomicrobium sp.]|jgi:chromosome partitioning protein
MHVLVMASQKGGSGKTTLSGHLAVEAEQSGVGPVALIDTDPQGSLAQWWNAREATAPVFAHTSLADLGETLERLEASGIRLAVIDTPPAITNSISQVVAHADLVVVPTRPSPHDLRAVGATVDIAESHGKPLVFVVNGATQRARITGEAAVALSQHGTVAPTTLHHRVDFAASMVDGRTVGEAVPKSHSAREIRELWLYVQDRLSRLKHDVHLKPEARLDLSITPLSSSPVEASIVEERAPEPEAVFEPPAVVQPVELLPPEPLPQPIAELMLEMAEAEMKIEPAAIYTGPERRSGKDRRDGAHGFFGSAERRTLPFGRRATDRAGFGKLGHKWESP